MRIVITIALLVASVGCLAVAIAYTVGPMIRRWLAWRTIRRMQARHRDEPRKSVGRSK